MENIQRLVELGGESMIAILVTSVFMLAVSLAKLLQFTYYRFWTIQEPSREDLSEAISGLKIIEIASVIAPLLGLLGTVLGMITAFQSLEASGGSADITVLASGIWRALSTTAAGMVVSIVATIFLGIFDGSVERMASKIDLK